MNIKGLSKAELLTELYNAIPAHTQGILKGISLSIPIGLAEEAIAFRLKTKRPLYFGHFEGKDLHIDLSGDDLDTSGYNAFHGKEAAERVIFHLRRQSA